MRRLGNGAKEGYEQCADGDEQCAGERVARKGLAQDNGGAYRVENEARSLESGEDGEGEGGDLDGAADNICHEEHEHAQLSGVSKVVVCAGESMRACHLRRL